MSNLTGQTLKGYEFHQQIGSGGFGAVYHAYQPVLKREVAIKVIRPDYANDPDFIRRFEVEAELVARLEHPHIVPLFDFWREPDSAFLVMRLLRGGSLRSRIQTGALPPELIAKILDQVAGALHTAHLRGVIHRDIKPDNILLDEADNTYLTDFGIAKIIGARDTNPDAIQGSLHYISPEQLQGGDIGAFTDIYGLGIALYELVTGFHPFGEQTTVSEMVFKHLQEDVPSVQVHLPDLTAEIDEVIQKATAKNQQERFTTTLEMAQAFRRAITPVAMLNDTAFPFVIEAEVDPATLINPYKGLRAFQEYDQDDYYGREPLIQNIIRHLRDNRFIAIVGPSGSGKSSVVRAGVLPALRQGILPGSDNWFILEMFPGAYPFAELEAALLRIAINPPASLMEQLQQPDGLLRAVKRVLPGDEKTELVLLIDQFEELFTLTSDETQRTHFMHSLIAAVDDPHSRIRVIVTLRADFYDRPLQYRAFGERLDNQKMTVYPLSPEELERVIERPAEKAGAFLEAGLTQKIIADVGDQPGTLPLLQYALTELFERRDRRLLTLEAYHEIGGVTGALARRADDIVMGLDADQQQLARQLFLRLVMPGEGTEDTRRRARLSEMLSLHDGMGTVIDIFGASRLLTFDNDPLTREPTLEVAHEALIRTWERMRAWLATSRDDLRLQRRLNVAAQEWQEASDDEAFLARDARLQQFESLLDSDDIQLNALEKAYIQASIQSRTDRQQREEQRKAYEAELEKRAVNRLRYLVAGLTVFLVVAGALTVFAFSQSQAAQAGRDAFQTQAFIAETAGAIAQTAASIAQTQAIVMERNAETAVAAEAEAVRQADIAATAQANALAQADIAITAAAEANTAREDAEAERDRADLQAEIAISQRVASQALREIESRPDVGLLLSIEAFKRNDNFDTRSTLLTAINNRAGNTTFLRDMRYPATAADISPDGRWLAVANENFEILLWDLHTGQRVGNSWEPPSDNALGLKFTPDSQRLYSVDKWGDFIEWEVPTGNILNLRVLPFPGRTSFISFNQDASLLAMTTSLPPSVTVFDVASGEPIGESLKTQAGFPYALTFSPDSRLLVVEDLLSQSGAAEIWNIETGELLKTLKQLAGFDSQADIFPSVFSADGDKLAIAYLGKILVWDWVTETFVQVEPIAELESSTGFTPLYFSRDGSRLYFRSFDNTIISADTITGKTLPDVLTGLTAEAFYLLMTPDESQMVGIDENGQIVIWRVDGKQTLRDSLPLELPFHATFSPDAAHIAYVDSDNHLRILSTSDGQPVLEVETAHTDIVSSAAYSPDGRWLATGDESGKIILWDVQAGTAIRTWTEHADEVRFITFSPDSNRLFASGTEQAQKLIFDVITGDVLATLLIPTVANIADIQHSAVSAAFSPDGRFLALATVIGRLQLYDMTTYEPLRSTTIPAVVYALTFNADSTLLAVQGDNKTILLLDVETLEAVRRPLVGHVDLPVGIAFSPDGSLLASTDENLYVWDVATGQLLGSPLPLHSDNSRIRGQEIHFSNDGTRLMVLAKNGVTRWNLDFGAISDAICHQANLNLTLAEWERFFPGEPYRSTCPNSSFYLVEFTQYAAALADKAAAAELFQVIGAWSRHVSDDNALIIVCQYGALYGFAESVLPACDNFVGRDAIWQYRLSRSYARAMSGDLTGAAEDLEAALSWLRQLSDWEKQLGFEGRDASIQEREKWLVALQSGENPYADETTLATLRERLELIAALPEEETPDEEQSIFGPVLTWDQLRVLPFDAVFIGNVPGSIVSFTNIEDVSDFEKRLDLFGEWALIGANGDIALTYSLGFPEESATLLITSSPAPVGQDALAWVNNNFFDAQLVTLESGIEVALADGFAAVIYQDVLMTFITPVQDKGNAVTNLPEVIEAALTNTFLYSEYAVITTMQAIQTQAADGKTAEAEQALIELLPQLENEDNPVLHNQVCWVGSLAGFAEKVLPSCEKAVELAAPDQVPFYQDSRGLGRALTGDIDGAIEDFTAFVTHFADSSEYAEMVALRQDILAALQAGENPFDEALLDQLRSEGS